MTRVNGNLNLSRAIGDLKYKSNRGLPAAQQIITAEPDVRSVELTAEDRFLLLACDGVWDVMSNQQVRPRGASCAAHCAASSPKVKQQRPQPPCAM